MKIKVMRQSGEELLIDTTSDAVVILMTPKERESLADIAQIQNTMLQVPYKRMRPARCHYYGSDCSLLQPSWTCRPKAPPIS